MARPVLRGEVLWADLDPVIGHEQGGRRPIVVLSGSDFNSSSQTVIALPLTSRVQAVPYPLAVRLADGVAPKPSWVKIGQVRTIALDRIGERISLLAPKEVDALVQALNRLLRD